MTREHRRIIAELYERALYRALCEECTEEARAVRSVAQQMAEAYALEIARAIADGEEPET